MSHHLSKENVARFQQSGFLVVAEMDAAVTHIIDSAANVRDVAADAAIIGRIWQPSKRHPVFRRVHEDPRVLDAMESLIGPDIVFHHCKLNMKEPRIGSPVEWHQDFSYYPHTNTKLVACLIYLDDADEGNGCLRVLAGSHRAAMYDHTTDSYFRGKVDPATLPDGYEEVAIAGRAGTAVFLHCKVLHRSDPNHSERYRRVFIPAYRAADSVPIYFGPHAAQNEPDAYLLRGQQQMYATVEGDRIPLPITEKAFNSLFALQQGEHVRKDGLHEQPSGYATHA